jgi:type II secretory pathway component PulF
VNFLDFMWFLKGVVVWLVVWALPVTILALVCYHYLHLPLLHQERARLVLDLLETGLKDGRSLEQTIKSASACRDVSLGAAFHQVAAYLEMGAGLRKALEHEPNFLPPPITAMLRTGQEIPRLDKVLAACRKMLTDGSSKVRSAINYQVVMMFSLNPMGLVFLWFLQLKILPVFREIYVSFGTRPSLVPDCTQICLWLLLFQVLLIVLVYAGVFAYISGPRVKFWVDPGIFPISDWVAWMVPWQRKRLQRNFSLMLSMLLDAGVPEPKALLLAAESTANRIFAERAGRAMERLEQGTPLTAAVSLLDDSGEFRWRLANAAHGQRGFERALAGWHDSLDAQAFRQEQAAAQVTTTLLTVFNGVLVALLTASIFRIMSGIYGF